MLARMQPAEMLDDRRMEGVIELNARKLIRCPPHSATDALQTLRLEIDALAGRQLDPLRDNSTPPAGYVRETDHVLSPYKQPTLGELNKRLHGK